MIKFFGGASKVTGSAILFEIANHRILIDCGAEQGFNVTFDELEKKIEGMPKIDYCILTHAHIDHSGLIPLLVKKRKVNAIISSPATKSLSAILLNDYAKIQQENAVGFPLYTENDVASSFLLWQEKDNKRVININNMEITLYNNSHIVGSTSVFVKTDEGNYLFSGDIGTSLQQLMDYPPEIPSENIDYLILESTYGDRKHNVSDKGRLKEIIEQTCSNGGKVLIPVFAVGRLQEVLYIIAKENIKYPVYVDTPMGNRVIDLIEDYRFYLKKEIRRLIVEDKIFGEYTTVNSNLQSINLAESKEPAVILSASGMLEGGRVLNHLQTIKDDKKSTIVFVGYQVEGSRGRKILDGEESVQCGIEKLSSFSAHADQEELIEYVNRLPYMPYKIFLVHGEKEARESLAKALKKMKLRVESPSNLDEIITIKFNTKPVYFQIKPEFIQFGGYNLAPFAGFVVEKEEYFEVVDKTWFDQVFKDISSQTLSQIQPVINTEEELYVEIDIDDAETIKKNIDFLMKEKVLSKKRLKEFWEQYINGPTAARAYVLKIHKKNENTGIRRWQQPEREMPEEEKEMLFEMAYKTLTAATYLEQNVLYNLLTGLEIKI